MERPEVASAGGEHVYRGLLVIEGVPLDPQGAVRCEGHCLDQRHLAAGAEFIDDVLGRYGALTSVAESYLHPLGIEPPHMFLRRRDGGDG